MSVFTQGLSAEQVALCRDIIGAEKTRELSAGAPNWIHAWQQRSGDLDVADDDDDMLIASVADANSIASITFALYRKQIPVLLLGDASPLGLTSGLANRDSCELLTQAPAEGDAASASIREFLTPAPTPGRIFTIEGGDGAGKQTQTRLLAERLEREGYPVRTIDFPHDSAAYGKKIREILSGRHGSISEVSPLLFATVYSMNRDDVRPTLRHWLRRGHNVVLDRYMESSFGHQAAKLPTEEEKQKMISRLTSYEVNWLGIPPSHRVLYLDLDPAVALAALKGDGTRKGLDIHETAKSDYKDAVRSCFRWCCSTFSHWKEVPQQNGAVRKTPAEVHHEIWSSLQAEFVNQGQAGSP